MALSVSQKENKIKISSYSKKELLDSLRAMLMTREIEEITIKMSKSGEGHFWIGGPGEECFNVSLGQQVKKGFGPEFDFLHLHYRSLGVGLAMGLNPKDSLRQMAMKATDPYSGGRNFCNHIASKELNITPVTSTIGTQFASAIGTARVQSRTDSDGITIVIGGDAGTAEADFASCLYWSSNENDPLPILLIVTNNSYGISTPISQVWGEKRNIAKRADGFGIENAICNGNDFEEVNESISKAMKYVRGTGKPFLLEVCVSRLNGHSSSSGANRVDEVDPLDVFSQYLINNNVISGQEIDALREDIRKEVEEMLEEVRKEKDPEPESAEKNLFKELEPKTAEKNLGGKPENVEREKPQNSPKEGAYRIPVSDAAKKIAEENSLTLDKILGTGRMGEITAWDVEKVLKNKKPRS